MFYDWPIHSKPLPSKRLIRNSNICCKQALVGRLRGQIVANWPLMSMTVILAAARGKTGEVAVVLDTTRGIWKSSIPSCPIWSASALMMKLAERPNGLKKRVPMGLSAPPTLTSAARKKEKTLCVTRPSHHYQITTYRYWLRSWLVVWQSLSLPQWEVWPQSLPAETVLPHSESELQLQWCTRWLLNRECPLIKWVIKELGVTIADLTGAIVIRLSSTNAACLCCG